ncbi:sulfite reductase flavoprotein subunit alpha [Psychrobacter sp. HD31]|uniref:diflavin oxidoreductase n=1 Tax=Psychrobacter sp. HD31 TaxID=3112003 RepID=UPI003DA52233
MDKQKLVDILSGGLQSAALPIGLPLNKQQKQWLGGFFAGLQTQSATAGGLETTGKPLLIIYGTQTGNSEAVAEDAAAAAKANGLAPVVMDMDDVDVATLANTERLLVVTSTYGEGEMPDNAHLLWEAICEESAPTLDKTFYSVLALGDSSYDDFCLAGKEWDERLQSLGATKIADRVDCDVDFDEAASGWIETVLPIISEKGSDEVAAPTAATNKPAKSKFNRKNPLPAILKTKRILTAPESSKEIVHYEFDLADSGETYVAGDALNIVPVNRDDLVNEFLAYFAEEANDTVRQQLTTELEIRTPSKELVKLVAEKGGDDELNRLLANNDPEALDDFLWGKDCYELVTNYAGDDLTLNEFLATCKPLVARAYSISSSIKKHENEVHLTIGSVRYKTNERHQNGVASTYLADIANEGDTVHCYFSPNKSFKIPQDGSLPIIMVGPGTGIAPFRSFLEAREMTQATGDNWLLFGDRNAATDFIYREEVEAMQASGLLTKLSLAFSRDQAEKIYVQDRMKEEGAELFAWLERGGYFYICGDAYRMAKDVDKALHELIAEHGNMSDDEAVSYVNQLKKDKRYVRDVY